MVEDDVSLRWFLNAPSRNGAPVSVWQFGRCERVSDLVGLVMSIRSPGKCVDFTYADFGIPVVSCLLAEEIRAHCGDAVQLIPVQIDAVAGGSFFILNVLAEVDCLDGQRSDVQRYGADDGFPDKVGKPEMILKFVLDPSRVSETSHMFRLHDYRIALIVDEKLAVVLRAASGITLRQLETVFQM